MKRKLPPMKALIAFESVSRLGSVTKAAEELFVTHSAISKQVATLEEWFGRPLFEKNRKLMQPTQDGMILASAADQAWDLIAEAIDNLRIKKDSTVLKVQAPSTFAMRWLIPRVWSFSEENQRIELQLRQTDSLEAWLDIPFDVAIRSNPTVPNHLTTAPFLSVRADPRHISGRATMVQRLKNPADLSSYRVPARWRRGRASWRRGWRRQAWRRRHPGRWPTRISTWRLRRRWLVAGRWCVPGKRSGDLLAKGELVELWPHIRVTGPTYAAVYDAGSPHAEAAKVFVGWLSGARRPSVLAA